MCIDNSRKLLKIYGNYKNEFSQVTGYKINIKKITCILYTSNEQSESEIKTILFTPKKIKMLSNFYKSSARFAF